MNDADNLERHSATVVRKLEARNQALQAGLQAANQEIDSLTFSIAHDLRTPLMHIDGFAQLLRESAGTALGPASLEHLDRVVGAAQTMDQLIAALITYSKLNRANLLLDEVDLEEVLDEALAQVSPSCSGRNIQWHRARLPTVRADASLLRHAFVNLLSNAIKYTRARDPAVIEIGTRTDETGAVIVFVRDNGVGFDLQYAGRLFSPFQRMHSTAAFQGVGMGLATVRRIITRHGGRVWAQAAPGSGATFFVSLPQDTDE